MDFNNKTTKWENCYRHFPLITSVTRRITALFLLQISKKLHIQSNRISICELGGGNSSFIKNFLKTFNSTYKVIDNNDEGLRFVTERYISDSRVSIERNDLRKILKTAEKHDLVLSVGLIEHFTQEDFHTVLQNHFTVSKKGGYVILVFPVSSIIYLSIRKILELINKWPFPDEKPLQPWCVVQQAVKYGSLKHKTTNWLIPWTQIILVVRHEK